METYVEEQKTNSNAIISLVLSILSWCIPVVGFILAIVGIVLSLKAKKTIKTTNEKGSGLATAGLIVSIVSLVFQILAIIGIIVFFFVIASDVATYSTY